jgi:2'-hydroxyisoflavone reductase
MRILVVGGTRFVGRALVDDALAQGHDVTVLHRGSTGPDLFPDATHVLADRNEPADLAAALAGLTFDATVDTCAYAPHQVTTLADALDGRGGHHLYVSTVSVYAGPDGPGEDESSRLYDPPPLDTSEVDMRQYGALKVACEIVAGQRHDATGLAVVRPTYVVGPHDYTWRFTWWVHRLGLGGDVLCPGPADQAVQIVDARDQATFMLGLLESRTTGTFHAATPSATRDTYWTWGAMIEGIASVVAPPGTRLRWVPADRLLDAGLASSALPLWHWGDDDSWGLAMDASAAYTHGLQPRPLADVVADTAAWARTTGGPPSGTGLAPDREKELLG